MFAYIIDHIEITRLGDFQEGIQLKIERKKNYSSKLVFPHSWRGVNKFLNLDFIFM